MKVLKEGNFSYNLWLGKAFLTMIQNPVAYYERKSW